MAPAGTNPKIEELRFKLKADPKSRLFYPLAEELRKAGQAAEAEQVLRGGLSSHPTYLSAWVVLGRVLREQGKHSEAIDPLNRALELDRGNVVAARLLAETYLALGDRVEAIKKYKLVHALLPGDNDTEAMIHRLETELSAAPVPAAAEEPWAEGAAPAAGAPAAAESVTSEAPATGPPPAEDRDPFEITYNRLKRDARNQAELEVATGDAEPMAAAHAQSPFEEQAAELGYSADAFAVEEPAGVHLAAAPLGAELPTEFPPPALPAETEPPVAESLEEAELFEPASEIAPGFIQGSFDANVPPPPPSADDFARTITMADLYASQGLIDDARSIYDDVLARDPGNEIVLARLQALDAAAPVSREPEVEQEEGAAEPEPVNGRPDLQKIRRLENWLSKVKRSGVESV